MYLGDRPCIGFGLESPRAIPGLEYVNLIRPPSELVKRARQHEAAIVIARSFNAISKHFRNRAVAEAPLRPEIQDLEHERSRNRLARISIDDLSDSWTDRFRRIGARRLGGAAEHGDEHQRHTEHCAPARRSRGNVPSRAIPHRRTT